MITMSGRSLRVLFLIWLCWYLAGPLFETFDFWDTPQEELLDIASSTSGALIWAAAEVCLAVLLLRQLCKYSRGLARIGTNAPLRLNFNSPGCFPPTQRTP